LKSQKDRWERVKQPHNLTRRDFIIKSAGALGFVALLSSPLIPALNRVKADDKALGVPRATGAAQAAGTGQKARAWCMVIDLQKCEGCVTIDSPPQCTQSCVAGHFVPKGQKWIEVYEKKLSGGGSFFMPTPCYQCENAPCVNVCPVAATYHN
jgi:hypothetical protein